MTLTEKVTTREIDGRIMKIMVPIMIEYSLMMLSSTILTSYIGRMAVDDISIYGMGTRIASIFFALFRGMGVGVMILEARSFGERNLQRCRWLQHESYFSVFPAAVILTLLIILFPRQFLTIMTSDPALLDRGTMILRLLGIFMPLQALIGLNSAAFQAFGNTRTPMFIAAFGNILSIIVGYVLILGFNGIGGFGLIGAVWSQIISWSGMTLLGLFLIYGPVGLYKDIKSDHPLFSLPAMEDVKTIYNSGVPVALENSYWSVATVYISRVILLYGSSFYAAYNLGLQAEGLCDVLSAGFLTGAMSLSAMAIGARDDDLYRRYYARLNFFCLIVCGLTMAFLGFGSTAILRFLTDKQELITIGYSYLFAMVFSQIPQHMAKVISGYIRATGHEKVPSIISLCGVILRVLLVILFGQILHKSINWVWWAFNIDLWFRYTVSMIYGKTHHTLDYVSEHRQA